MFGSMQSDPSGKKFDIHKDITYQVDHLTGESLDYVKKIVAELELP